MEYFGDTNIVPLHSIPQKKQTENVSNCFRAPIEFKLRPIDITLSEPSQVASVTTLSNVDHERIAQIEEELREWGEGFGYDADTVAWRFAHSGDEDAKLLIKSRQLSYNT